jgi:hypothetical protein
VRWTNRQGQEQVCVRISTLSSLQILRLAGAQGAKASDQTTVLAAYAHFYDARGGGIETSFKQDQQGRGRRNKKCFAAQAMLLWLECLAHNVLVWARSWLASAAPVIAGYGLFRLVRDALAIPGVYVWMPRAAFRGWFYVRALRLRLRCNRHYNDCAQQKTRGCLGEI